MDILKKTGNKYLVFVLTDDNKELIAKFIKLWDKIEYLIETINVDKKGEYEKDLMKIRLESDDDLSLNKILNLMLTVIVWSIFEEDGKYKPQVSLDECLYEV